MLVHCLPGSGGRSEDRRRFVLWLQNSSFYYVTRSCRVGNATFVRLGAEQNPSSVAPCNTNLRSMLHERSTEILIPAGGLRNSVWSGKSFLVKPHERLIFVRSFVRPSVGLLNGPRTPCVAALFSVSSSKGLLACLLLLLGRERTGITTMTRSIRGGALPSAFGADIFRLLVLSALVFACLMTTC